MANSDLGYRFTNEKYATKSEVAKDLGIRLVDNIWANILRYRESFNKSLMIKSIEGKNLVLCECQSVNGMVSDIEFACNRSASEFIAIQNDRGVATFNRKCLIECLKNVAKSNNLEVSDEYLRMLINGEMKEVDAANHILLDYYNALVYVESFHENEIDEDFLAGIYMQITNNDELVSFYRTSEDNSKENRFLIERIYTAAPVGAIEAMMENLFKFIKNEKLDPGVKALIAYYYFNYVKPFPKLNGEIALILMKAIIAHENKDHTSVYMPLERMLHERLPENAKVSIEVQKANDVTYFVKFGARFFGDIANEFIADIQRYNAEAMSADFYKEDKEPEQPVEEPVSEEPVQEEVQPRQQTTLQELAVSYIPPALDEKAVMRLEQDLLESDPSLKKGEAYFYARHCTMNKRYTIAQYKKELGCAYETARTSMEHLAELGYYRKEQVKNKFVYTPINRRKD